MNYSKEQIEEFESYRHNLIGAVAKSVSPYILQLFFDTKRGIPKATGCGVLFEIENNYFVITAAHVLAEHSDTTYAVIGNDGVYLGGLMFFVALSDDKKRKDDKIDLAFVRLDSSTAEIIKKQHSFLTIEDFKLGHRVHGDGQYLLFGYPATKTKSKKVNHEDLIIAAPFIYDAKTHQNFKYEKFGFQEVSHIAINFTGEIITNVNKNSHLAPSMEGLSGSGLWYLPAFPSPDVVNQRKLVGIVIERINELNNKVIVSTSIDLVTESLRNNLGIMTIPKSSKVNLNSRII
jgi:hypothetical protein